MVELQSHSFDPQFAFQFENLKTETQIEIRNGTVEHSPVNAATSWLDTAAMRLRTTCRAGSNLSPDSTSLACLQTSKV